jgi:TonB-linked SusC/RagA family outer membrane protein
MIRFVSFVSIGVGLAIGVAAASAMQANSQQQQPVRFLLASTSTGGPPVMLDVTRMPVLRQRLTLDFQGVTIGEALTAISDRAKLVLWYADDVIATNRRVNLRANEITVAAALTDVLVDAGVDVVFNKDGTAVIVKRMGSVAFVQIGTISGHVTDSASGKGIGGVAIVVEGTQLSTTTAGDGGYTIRGVPAGNRSITARRLGFVRRSQAVTVGDNDLTTIDFVLVPTPTMLGEVVTTATGDQRIVELGHVVGRINADSVVKSAPVSSISELLNGRMPGVQVNTYQGTVGGDVALQVRAPNTINLSTEPIVIVDGVRYTSNAAARVNLGSGNFVESTSPLNDLNPNEIESIEIAKGPSAATLYGTDAANGVIILKTKRGRPGPARWNAYVKGGATTIPQIGYPDAYWGWRTIRGAPSLTSSCTLDQVGRGLCTQDSVTVMPNPLNNPALTIFQRAPRWEYGANVSGGSADLRYFFAADLEDATGPVRMPHTMADSISSVRELLPEQLNPNALSKVNLRSNITATLGSTAELQVNVGYSNRATRTLGGGFNNPYAGAFGGPTPGLPYGSKGPDQLFSRTTTERVNRLFSSVTGHWSPVSWLLARGSGGLDVSSLTRSSLVRRGEAPRTLSRTFSTGEVDDDRGRQLAGTWEVAATATFSSTRVSSRTTAGAQYLRILDDVLGSTGKDLPPGASTIGAAASVQSSQNYREQVTLGSYFEQSFGFNQRLFLTGALRRDGASTFGRNYTAAVYPKIGISWLLSNEPALPRIPMIDELRLRYAFGASGQQPQPGWNRPGYAVQQAVLDGSLTNAYTVNSLGNPELRPEQVREHEFGFDATTFDHRVQLGLTWHGRRTIDQIVNVALPPGLGNMFTNLGVTTSSGFESQLSARLFESRALSWEIGFLHSSYVTTLRHLGGAVARRSPFGGWVEGYPLGARFQRPLSFKDTNGDGIISVLEVQFGDTAVYVGQSTPPRSQTITNTVSLLDRRLRLSGLVERRSGFTQVNSGHRAQCSSAICRERIDPRTALSQQAAGIAPLALGDYTYIEPGDFTRLREVTLAADLPLAAARALRFSSATVSLQGRNLALWTSYSGEDPESASPRGFSQQEIGIPQGRSWAVRFDFGF